MKIKVVTLVDAPDLRDWLRAAAVDSGKSVLRICREAQICSQVWYAILRGDRSSVSQDLLNRLEGALGQKYPVGE